MNRPFKLHRNGSMLMMEGPGINMPCDVSDLPEPDSFVEMCNDIYEAGFKEGQSSIAPHMNASQFIRAVAEPDEGR